MVEVGIAEYFGIGEALGIIGTMFVVLYFSRKQMHINHSCNPNSGIKNP
jgi:hypothetical protein